MATYDSDDMKAKFPPDILEDESQGCNLNSLMLPFFSATNSLVVTMDRTLNTVFPLPFVAGPASSTSAAFTVLAVAHKVNVSTTKSSLSIYIEEIDQEINVDENTILKNLILTCPVDPPPAWKMNIFNDYIK